MTNEEFVTKYLVDRHNTDCNKWDAELEEKYGTRDLISMWIDDLVLRTPDAVFEALTMRVQLGFYGYADIPV